MSTPARPRDIEDLRLLVGTTLGPSSWKLIEQSDVDSFADLSGDGQWIHVDTARSKNSVFGTTLAHGLYVLSLAGTFMAELLRFDSFGHGLNYGYDRVRFPAPTPVGSRIRMRARIAQVRDISDGVADVFVHRDFECEGIERPVCVATNIGRFFEAPSSSSDSIPPAAATRRSERNP